MKKTILGLLCLCLLLCGCQDASSQPEQTMPPATENLPAAMDLPLLEQGTALEESGNLLYIPNETVQRMTNPQMRLFGNGLLLRENSENMLVLKHISLENGALVKEGSVPAGPDAKLFIGNGQIGICDRESGSVSILDEAFRLQTIYDIPREGDDWYLNSELDTLYIFFSQQGLLVRDLESGEENWLVDNGAGVTAIGGGSGYVIFAYTDRGDQKTYTRCLNLSTATMETLPVSGVVSAGIRQGENWLLQNGEDYVLVKGDAQCAFAWDGIGIRLLSSKRHLLGSDRSGRNLTLYNTDGAFLSGCSLPQNSNAAVGADFIWSGYWEGYFFTDFIDGAWRLMFWNVNADTEGEDLQMQPLDAALPSRNVVEAALYERAAQLSQRFGVDIRIAEQCTLDYSHYDAYALTDPVYIRAALDVIEESLSRYPEDFFRQLPYGSIESIRMELVGGLSIRSDIDTHPASVGAFAQDRGGYYTIVADGFVLQPQTVFHEFSHIIDAKLEWDASLREDALYSEDAWLALQPKGFRYGLTYTEVPEELLGFMESGYFITDYALTYPTEDRAILMAAAMEGYRWDFEPGSGTREKLRYYAACIRDCFDTEGWPETAAWEQVLE